MTEPVKKPRLPPETDDSVVEVDLRHVVLAFGGVFMGVLASGTALILIRDWARFRRQKAAIESISQLIKIIQEGGFRPWKSAKEDTSSPQKK
ncbi:MAG: hypothetical protein V3U24_10695 [Candidatus Neomarinimicrobiota bacterium]